MNMQTQSQTKAVSPIVSQQTGLLQRQCACGQHTIAGEECAECRQKRAGTMQRAAVSAPPTNSVPPIVHDVLASSSQPFDAETRAFMEPRFEHNFSQVKIHNQYPFSATIRRVPYNGPAGRSSNAMYDADEAPSNAEEMDIGPIPTQTDQTPSYVAINEPEEGETIHLPDIVIPSIAEDGLTDTVVSALTYNASITQGGTVPSNDFGITYPFNYILTNINITRLRGAFQVTASIDNPVTFQVQEETGPHGQVNITSSQDLDITSTNYNDVTDDLTPGTSGKPPRHKFWARDLTIIHERFHADESIVHGRSAAVASRAWLNSQAASSVIDVNTLLGQVPARMKAVVKANMAPPGREARAYSAGAQLYRERANAIKAIGAKGQYPSLPAGDYPDTPSTGDIPV